MGYSKYDFRDYYHHFVAIGLDDNLKELIKDFPGAKVANFLLAYGYIDREAGFTFEVLASCKRSEASGLFVPKEPNDNIRVFIRANALPDTEMFFFDEKRVKYKDKYKNKIEMLKTYDVDELVEDTRELVFLDDSRDDYFIDDVLVYLNKEGLQTEGCWTRITGHGDHYFIGDLLNEPNQDFGYHKGEQIAFNVEQPEEGKVICVSNMNPDMTYTEEDMEDGHLLEEAIKSFNEERTQENFIQILEFLRDSYVYVPCKAVLSERDQKRMDDLFEGKSEDEIMNLAGTDIQMKDEVRMIPDILTNGDDYFFPVFTSEEAMGEYGKNFSKVQKHMLEVIPLAINNEKNPKGIVVNAFTDSFVLESSIYDIVQNAKSRIVEKDDDKESKEA